MCKLHALNVRCIKCEPKGLCGKKTTMIARNLDVPQLTLLPNNIKYLCNRLS